MLFLSTVYTGNEYEPRIRRRPTTTQPRARPILQIFSDKPIKTLEIPSIAAEYNDNMNAVDIGDQLRQYLSNQHAVCKGNWRALAWSFLLETTLVNTFILQSRGQPLLNLRLHKSVGV